VTLDCVWEVLGVSGMFVDLLGISQILIYFFRVRLLFLHLLDCFILVI